MVFLRKGSEPTFHRKEVKTKSTWLKDSSVSYSSEKLKKFSTSVPVRAAEILKQPT